MATEMKSNIFCAFVSKATGENWFFFGTKKQVEDQLLETYPKAEMEETMPFEEVVSDHSAFDLEGDHKGDSIYVTQLSLIDASNICNQFNNQ